MQTEGGPDTRYDRRVTAVRDDAGPRERILEAGVETLTDRELLAAVLGTGCAGTPVLDVAERILRESSLDSLARATARDLKRMRGLGAARACQMLALFEIGRRVYGRTGGFDRPIRSPEDAVPLVQHYASAAKEHFLIVLLNTRHRPIGVEVVSIGTLSASLVHPREVFRPAIVQAAASVILVHNHPSGDPTPSEDDLDITQRLRRVGEMVGIEVLDHLILGAATPYSMRQAGLF